MHIRKQINRGKRAFRILFERLKNIRKKRVLVLGDSHVAVFNYINNNHETPFYFEVGYVSGATALGVANPNSKTNALSIFRNKLSRTSKKTPLIIQLGEVDCGFVIWFLSQKKNLPIQDQFEKSLRNYFGFVKAEILDKGFKEVIIMSATLPTLKENNPDLGEIAHLRKEVTASQKERTQLTLEYNRKLAEFCAEHTILNFLDLDPFLLDSGTGFVKDKYMNNDPLDHHNDMTAYSELIIEELKSNEYLY